MGLKTIIIFFFPFIQAKGAHSSPTEYILSLFFNHHMAHVMIDFYKLSAFNFENPFFVLQISPQDSRTPQCDFNKLTAMN